MHTFVYLCACVFACIFVCVYECMQALCELYNLPVEIWAYCPQFGARKLRTFHEVPSTSNSSGLTSNFAVEEDAAAAGSGAVIRLSYYGGGHYDSIVPLSLLRSSAITPDGSILLQHEQQSSFFRPYFPRMEPGAVEDLAIARSRSRQRNMHQPASTHGRRHDDNEAVTLAAVVEAEAESARLQSDQEATELLTLGLALEESRRLHLESDQEDIETCLLLSMQQAEAMTGEGVEKGGSNSSREYSRERGERLQGTRSSVGTWPRSGPISGSERVLTNSDTTTTASSAAAAAAAAAVAGVAPAASSLWCASRQSQGQLDTRPQTHVPDTHTSKAETRSKVGERSKAETRSEAGRGLRLRRALRQGRGLRLRPALRQGRGLRLRRALRQGEV